MVTAASSVRTVLYGSRKEERSVIGMVKVVKKNNRESRQIGV